MKLVFYSGGHDFENVKVDSELIRLINKEDPLITYIPSCSYSSDNEYREFVSQYQKYNIKNILNFPVDIPYSDVLKETVLKSDMIHLGGGNTYYFLKHLRKSGFLKELKDYVKNGGVLTGLSAGAIIMTRAIDTAGFPHFDCDENEENMRNLKGMGLANFDFFPHYKNSKRYDKELFKHSKKTDHPLYACPDGSGIIINNEDVSFIGKTYCFYKGKKFSVK